MVRMYSQYNTELVQYFEKHRSQQIVYFLVVLRLVTQRPYEEIKHHGT